MRIAVFGATGRTGVPLVTQALDRGHEVVAFVRTPETLPLTDDPLRVVVGDAYTGDGVQDAVENVDAVVSVLGQTSEGPDNLLTVAGDHILAAMRADDVSRLVTLVGAGVREEGERVSMSGRVMGGLLKLLAGEALADASEHVRRVRETGLDWTVVRAPRLTDGEGTGDYRAGAGDPGFAAVARADVARFVLDCLENDEYVRAMPTVGPA
jgi:putative NADH-flavin reductase